MVPIKFPDSVDIRNEVVAASNLPGEFDVQISSRLANLDTTVLAEPGQQDDSLPEHAIPGVSIGVLQALALERGPLGKQHSARIFSTKECSQRSFEGAAEQHRRPCVLLLPAIKIAMAIAPRAGEVMADLRVAVGHQATCGLSRLAGESSAQRSAGAKPSSRNRNAPLTTMRLIFTTPISPTS